MKYILGKALGALTGALMFASMAGVAQAEERTLSLYMVHTKEKLTVTYKKDGKYIPSAMKKLNWFLRDWRRNESTKMDPKTIDLMWELHADLGSKKPVHIISGYRSAKTNALLKRIGRKVARRSQHIQGSAIDMYFPDVSSEKVRNSALVREIGGVGYYPRSGKHGFVHIDSGSVRHWPRLSDKRLAQVKKANKKTVGARYNRPGYEKPKSGGQKLIASLFNRNKSKSKDTAPAPQQVAAAEQAKPQPQNGPVSLTEGLKTASIVPTPRPKPYEIYVQAAQAQQLIAANDRKNLQVAPASAPIQRVVNGNYNLDGEREQSQLGLLAATVASEGSELASLAERDYDEQEDREFFQRTNTTGKGSFIATWIDDTTIVEAQPIYPTQASISATPENWAGSIFASLGNLIRFVSGPSAHAADREDAKVVAHQLVDITPEESAALDQAVSTFITPHARRQAPAISGKADLLVVNRTGKGNLVQ